MKHSVFVGVKWARRGLLLGLLGAVAVSGCAKNKDLERISREQASTIQGLSTEIARLNDELDQAIRSREDLDKAKQELERKLKDELGSGDLSLSMQERGLVLTVQDKVLFDSGKADLKQGALATLKKIATILQEKVGQHMINVEGHTDNVPIRHSGWKSNWELSTSRATGVIHYFIEQGLDPVRFAALGYAEYHPVASNDAPTGRGLNRRVEIVISPRKLEVQTA